MAINKNKNINLQLTISKQDNERLLLIQEELTKSLNIELTKSQTIAFLIKNYLSNENKIIESRTNQKERLINEEIKHKNELKFYQDRTNLLKTKLDKSYNELSLMLGINASTLKKYCGGKQAPTKENKQILNSAFKKYGIL